MVGTPRKSVRLPRVPYTVNPSRVPSLKLDRLPDIPANSPLDTHRPPSSVLPDLAAHKAATAAMGPPPVATDGRPVSIDVNDAPVVDMVSKRPEAIAATNNAFANEPNLNQATPEEVGKANSGWARTLKTVLISNFVSVALGGAVATYFLVTAQQRRECIAAVFAKYPWFANADVVEAKMKALDSKVCGATESADDKYCRSVQDAYQMLKDCDNTLMKNLVAGAANAATPLVDVGMEQLNKLASGLGGMFSGVLPIILGVVGAIIVACIALWFFTRPKGEGAPGPGRFVGNVRGRFRRFRGGAVEQAEQAFGKHMRSAARGLLN